VSVGLGDVVSVEVGLGDVVSVEVGLGDVFSVEVGLGDVVSVEVGLGDVVSVEVGLEDVVLVGVGVIRTVSVIVVASSEYIVLVTQTIRGTSQSLSSVSYSTLQPSEIEVGKIYFGHSEVEVGLGDVVVDEVVVLVDVVVDEVVGLGDVVVDEVVVLVDVVVDEVVVLVDVVVDEVVGLVDVVLVGDGVMETISVIISVTQTICGTSQPSSSVSYSTAHPEEIEVGKIYFGHSKVEVGLS